MTEAQRKRRIRIGSLTSMAAFVVMSSCSGTGETGAEFSIVASESITDPTGLVGFGLAGSDVTENAPSLTVAADEPVTITYENKHGQYSRTSGIHDFAVVPVLDDLPTLVATGSIADHVLWNSSIAEMPTGETGEVTFTPTDPGTYHYICTIPGHAKLGMLGEFIVEDADVVRVNAHSAETRGS